MMLFSLKKYRLKIPIGDVFGSEKYTVSFFQGVFAYTVITVTFQV